MARRPRPHPLTPFANTPPTILFHAQDDPTVPVENSLVMFAALSDTLIHLPRLFRRTQPFPLHILLPGLAVLAVWSLVRVWHDDATQAFMIAFTTGVASTSPIPVPAGRAASATRRFDPRPTTSTAGALRSTTSPTRAKASSSGTRTSMRSRCRC